MGEYHDKDYVVICDERSDSYGEIGIVTRRPGCDTDLVHVGPSVICVRPQDLRRVRPGDRVVQP